MLYTVQKIPVVLRWESVVADNGQDLWIEAAGVDFDDSAVRVSLRGTRGGIATATPLGDLAIDDVEVGFGENHDARNSI